MYIAHLYATTPVCLGFKTKNKTKALTITSIINTKMLINTIFLNSAHFSPLPCLYILEGRILSFPITVFNSSLLQICIINNCLQWLVRCAYLHDKRQLSYTHSVISSITFNVNTIHCTL